VAERVAEPVRQAPLCALAGSASCRDVDMR
jgi:hypothetical protein